MLESMQRFDPSLGVEFQAFAMRRVRGTMINGLRREGKLRRGEAMFDADVVDNAAVSDGFSPEDPLAQLLRSDDHTSLAAALRQLSKLEYQRAGFALLQRDEQSRDCRHPRHQRRLRLANPQACAADPGRAYGGRN